MFLFVCFCLIFLFVFCSLRRPPPNQQNEHNQHRTMQVALSSLMFSFRRKSATSAEPPGISDWLFLILLTLGAAGGRNQQHDKQLFASSRPLSEVLRQVFAGKQSLITQETKKKGIRRIIEKTEEQKRNHKRERRK